MSPQSCFQNKDRGQRKRKRKGGNLFFTDECQLIDVKETINLENHLLQWRQWSSRAHPWGRGCQETEGPHTWLPRLCGVCARKVWPKPNQEEPVPRIQKETRWAQHHLCALPSILCHGEARKAGGLSQMGETHTTGMALNECRPSQALAWYRGCGEAHHLFGSISELLASVEVCSAGLCWWSVRGFDTREEREETGERGRQRMSTAGAVRGIWVFTGLSSVGVKMF